MKVKESINRFCFGLPAKKEMEKYISSISKNDETKKITTDIGIENFEIFHNNSFYFFILDIKQKVDINNLKNKESAWKILNIDKLVKLDRIFKKDSKEIFLTEKNFNYKRIVMTLELKNDPKLLETYKEIHRKDKVWSQIIDNMTTIGVIDMEIYLLGYRAFLIMDTDLDFDMNKDGERWSKLPREKEWQEYTTKFQKVDPKSKATEKWKTMKLVEVVYESGEKGGVSF